MRQGMTRRMCCSWVHRTSRSTPAPQLQTPRALTYTPAFISTLAAMGRVELTGLLQGKGGDRCVGASAGRQGQRAGGRGTNGTGQCTGPNVSHSHGLHRPAASPTTCPRPSCHRTHAPDDVQDGAGAVLRHDSTRVFTMPAWNGQQPVNNSEQSAGCCAVQSLKACGAEQGLQAAAGE